MSAPGPQPKKPKRINITPSENPDLMMEEPELTTEKGAP
jgi:hypothetical protein